MMIERLINQRDKSRHNGDNLARAVSKFIDDSDLKDLKLALKAYKENENYFVIGHAKAAKELATTKK